ncbi:ABC transporter ATP-binding protein [Clostridium polynesiense]|uniref:ABC transporter ATP-binding protein n=1 Tax=Clostridium polynesiense TaxID=1325933 RepID=UPI000AE5C175|nr:dipeptide ABC transporter ATP-binding protein [Clostridium polynesiense]
MTEVKGIIENEENKILEVKNLTKYFDVSSGIFSKKSYVHAVEDVSFDLYKGETLGVVGESGSGKSTLGRVLIKLLKPTSGEVLYKDRDISKIRGKEFKPIRRELQMVFQDPYASLNPRFKIGNTIAEPLLANKVSGDAKSVRKTVEELLELVGLKKEMYDRYPHEFSGGQRQRISIARAIALKPKILVCDEAVSALDVSVQAQILNLFNELKKKFNFTYIFIGHDLSVVKYLSDRILVMYLGEVVELATTESLFEKTLHPYTEALVSAIPEPTIRKKTNRIILNGDIPSPLNPPSGCRFATRCFKASERCKTSHPELIEVEPGHFVRCHHYDVRKEEKING